VGGLTADHGAQADDGVDRSAVGDAAGDRRDLERPGHPHHGDVILGDRGPSQRIDGAVDQRRGHDLVEPSRDDRDPQAGAVAFASDDPHAGTCGSTSSR
jgi:hypothetical protein